MVPPRLRSSCVKPPSQTRVLLVVVVVVRGTSFAAPIARFFSLFCRDESESAAVHARCLLALKVRGLAEAEPARFRPSDMNAAQERSNLPCLRAPSR